MKDIRALNSLWRLPSFLKFPEDGKVNYFWVVYLEVHLCTQSSQDEYDPEEKKWDLMVAWIFIPEEQTHDNVRDHWNGDSDGE